MSQVPSEAALGTSVAAAASAPPFLLRANDRVVFLGDSITEQRTYVHQVELVLAQGWPDLPLSFFNVGWGGDTARLALARLERDVLALEPTCVVVCLGMNDGGYADVSAARLADFREALEALVRRLLEYGARVVFVTPPSIDLEQRPDLAEYGRRGLRLIADQVLRTAQHLALSSADAFEMTSQLGKSMRARAEDLSFAPDGVHPNAAGHLVLARAALQALGAECAAARVSLVADPQADEPESSYGPVCFELPRLPVLISSDALHAEELLAFRQHHGQVLVSIVGLAAGDYLLGPNRISGLKFSHQELQAGIEVGELGFARSSRIASTLREITVAKSELFWSLWREHSLPQGKSGEHEPLPLQAARALGERFDEERSRLIENSAPLRERWYVTRVASDVAIDNEQLIGRFTASPFIETPELERLYAPFRRRFGTFYRDLALDVSQPANNLGDLLGPRANGCVYLHSLLISDEAQTCELSIGSDDSFDLWLNGKPILIRSPFVRALTPDEEKIQVELARGENQLTIKVTQFRQSYGLCVRARNLKSPLRSRWLPT